MLYQINTKDDIKLFNSSAELEGDMRVWQSYWIDFVENTRSNTTSPSGKYELIWLFGRKNIRKLALVEKSY